MPPPPGWWRSWGLQSCVLALVAIATILTRFGFTQAPILGDRGYVTYVGQAMLRGEPYYQTTFMGYPPLGAMLSAAAMWVGQWFDIPTYLAPRYLSVLAAALTVALLGLVARRALRNPWAGVFAGILLAGSSTFGEYTVGTLEPKALVNLFTLFAALALQHRRWTLAGLAAGLAAMCFQPAVFVVAAAFVVTLWGAKARPWKATFGFAGGVAIAVLPSLLYIVETASLWDYWQRAVVLPAADQLPDSGWRWDPFLWQYSGRLERSEAIVAICADAGFVLFAIGSARWKVRAVARGWLHPRAGGMPLFTLVWAGFAVLAGQGEPDLIQLVPLRAFWAAWLASRTVGAVQRLGRRWATPVRIFSGLLGAVTASFVLVDGGRHWWRPTLADQETSVSKLTAAAGPDGVISCFGAEWIYVVSERRSHNPFLRMNRKLAPFLKWVEPGGCNALLERLEAEQPAVVVIAMNRASNCMKRIPKLLYRRTNSDGRRPYKRVLLLPGRPDLLVLVRASPARGRRSGR